MAGAHRPDTLQPDNAQVWRDATRSNCRLIKKCAYALTAPRNQLCDTIALVLWYVRLRVPVWEKSKTSQTRRVWRGGHGSLTTADNTAQPSQRLSYKKSSFLFCLGLEWLPKAQTRWHYNGLGIFISHLLRFSVLSVWPWGKVGSLLLLWVRGSAAAATFISNHFNPLAPGPPFLGCSPSFPGRRARGADFKYFNLTRITPRCSLFHFRARALTLAVHWMTFSENLSFSPGSGEWKVCSLNIRLHRRNRRRSRGPTFALALAFSKSRRGSTTPL